MKRKRRKDKKEGVHCYVPLLACMRPRAFRAPDSENGDDDRPPTTQRSCCYVCLNK